jgi:hypothetical protein
MINRQIKEAARTSIIHANEALLRATLPNHPEVRKVLASIPRRLRKDLSISNSSFSSNFFIYMSMRELPSFKHLGLQRVLERFADWDANTRDHTENSDNVPNRDYHFSKEFAWSHDMRKRHVKYLASNYVLPETFKVTVVIMAYVKPDSDACHLEVVEVKEEVVRKEVKRIVCA